MCAEVLIVAGDEAPTLAADAQSLSGQIAAARGDTEGAKAAYRRAVFFLTGVGADRDAAQLWFELADLLEDVGDVDAARDAYRSAAASSGLRSRAKLRVRAHPVGEGSRIGRLRQQQALPSPRIWVT